MTITRTARARRLLVPAALLAAALGLAGCSSGMSLQGASYDESAPMPESAQYGSDGGSGDADFASSPESVDRLVVTTGWMTITAEEPIEAASEAIRITEAAGGRVDARTESAPRDGDRGRASLTLRLPSATLTQTIDRLKELGTVESIETSDADVTAEARDLDARITATSASRDRLLALLATATSTENLITLESAISERQASLESMQSQRRYLADQVSLSTIDVRFLSTADSPVADPDTFWSGLLAGWSGFVAFFSALLVGFGVLLPWLVLLGLIALVVVAVLRARRARALATPVAAPPVVSETVVPANAPDDAAPVSTEAPVDPAPEEK